jgi:hypothetical protein
MISTSDQSAILRWHSEHDRGRATWLVAARSLANGRRRLRRCDRAIVGGAVGLVAGVISAAGRRVKQNDPLRSNPSSTAMPSSMQNAGPKCFGPESRVFRGSPCGDDLGVGRTWRGCRSPFVSREVARSDVEPRRRVTRSTAPDSTANGRIGGMHLGIAHHYGWAVAVTASADYRVADRRRIELIELGLPTAPIHHEGGPHLLHRSGEPLDDNRLAALVADVRASVVRTALAALDELGTASPEPIETISLRAWPADFPEDIAVQRRVPYESRADSVMYCKVLAELAHERGWSVHTYNAKNVEDDAIRILGDRANEVLRGPGATLGPPWSKDHRMALAATIVAP